MLVVCAAILSGCATYDTTVVPAYQQGVTIVAEAPKLTKEKIFARAREWIALRFVSGQDVIQDKNLKTGRIIGNAISTIYMTGGLIPVPLKYRHSIVIDVKPGRARIKLGDYVSVAYGNKPTYAMYITPLNKEMRALATDFRAYIKAGGATAKNDNW